MADHCTAIKQINGKEDPIRLTKKFYDKAISKHPQEFFQILENTVHELEEGHKKYSELVCDYYALELRTRAYRDKTRKLKKDIARLQKGIAVGAAYANALKKQIADNQVVIHFLNGQLRQSSVVSTTYTVGGLTKKTAKQPDPEIFLGEQRLKVGFKQ
jgi:hypothetical protein